MACEPLKVISLLLQVAAGDQNNSKWSFQNRITPFAQFAKLRQYMGNIECVRNVIIDVMENSELKWYWRRTVRDFDNIVFVEWIKCAEIEDETKQKE